MRDEDPSEGATVDGIEREGYEADVYDPTIGLYALFGDYTPSSDLSGVPT